MRQREFEVGPCRVRSSASTRSLGLISALFLTLAAGHALFSMAAHAGDMLLGFALDTGGIDHTIWAEPVAVDGSGNIYLSGGFSATVDFDPGPGVSELTSSGDTDAYLQKLNADGDLEWVLGFGGAGMDFAVGMAASSAGNVVLTGLFEGTVDFDPGPGVFNLTSAFAQNTYVAMFDSSGAFQWAGAIASSQVSIMEMDFDGNLVIAGSLDGTVDFDMGPGISELTGSFGSDVFVCKYSPAGDLLWAGKVGAYSVDGLAVDASGNICMTGTLLDGGDLDPGPGVYSLSRAGTGDVFVLKLDGTGAFDWAGSFVIDTSDFGGVGDIAVDSAGDIYVSGYFSGFTDFDPGPGTYSLTALSRAELFAVKLDSTGNFVWASGTTTPTVNSLLFPMASVIDANGHLHITGFKSEDATDFDPGPGEYFLSGSGDRILFVWSLTSSGSFNWAGVSDSVGLTTTVGFGLAANDGGNVLVSGIFNRDVDVDLGPGEYVLTSTGMRSKFLLELEPQHVPIANDDAGETAPSQVMSVLSSPPSNSLLANDTDMNRRAVLTVTAYDATSALGASVLVNPDGTFSYDPTAVAALQSIPAGDFMVDTFTYTISDSIDTATATVSVIVHGEAMGLPAYGFYTPGVLILIIAYLGHARAGRARGSVQTLH